MSSYLVFAILMVTCQVYSTRPPDPAKGDCVLIEVSKSQTINRITVSNGYAGLCTNKEGFKDFKLCQGFCQSGQNFNGETMQVQPYCYCCRVVELNLIPVTLTCEDNSTMTEYVSSHAKCSCRNCEDKWKPEVPHSDASTQSMLGVEY